MSYPEAYIQFLTHFHGDRDYFECHELLEEYWKEVDPDNKGSVWVGLIQIAVSLYHYRRNNLRGAKRLIENAIMIVNRTKEHIRDLGLDEHQLLLDLERLSLQIEKQLPYKSMNLPIRDEKLIIACQNSCAQNKWNWCAPSDLKNQHLVNRHRLRDRSDVIENRVIALRQKQKNRNNLE